MRNSTQNHLSQFNFLRSLTVIVIVTLNGAILNAQPGTAPVNPPVGGMKIDGFLQRQDVLIGDWLKGGPGGSLPAGSYLFKDNGTPEAPYNGGAYVGKIFHKLDPFNNQNTDDIFDGGNKLHQDPNLWGWRTQKPPAKDDINHALVFITQDEDENVWVLITGDRMSTNGTSFLDIEFYQNSISKFGGPTGGFVSTGPDGGRTVGDLDVTLSYTGGGSVATVSFLRWVPGSEAGEYQWMDLTPPVGSAYVAANNGFVINVPYGAYGKTTYKSLQFIEAAINLSELIAGGAGGGPCQALPFRSIFIKTKSSASPTADLKDFIAPFAINFCTDDIVPSITAGGANPTLACNPSASDINAALGTATATDACSTPTVTFSDGAVQSTNCNRSQTRRFTATDECNNTTTTSRTATWIADATPPSITTGGGSLTLGCNPAASDINNSLGTATATDACGVPSITQSDGGVTSNGCSRSQKRTWSARDACGNTSTASRTVTWTDDITPPVLTTGGGSLTLGCNPAASDINNSLGTATATDACSVPTITQSDGGVTSDGCSRSQKRTFTARDVCGNTSTASRTVTWTADVTPPVLTTGGGSLTLGCNPAASDINNSLGTATATDACGVPTVSQSDGSVTSNGCSRSQTRTFTARDFCGNTSTASRTVTWTADLTPPVLTTGGGSLTLGCNPAASDINNSLGTATATDACGMPTVSQSDGDVTSDGCSRSQKRTFTARDFCGNTATASRTVTWTFDVTPPVIINNLPSVTLGCNPTFGDIELAFLGSVTATDACGPTTITHIETITPFGCTVTVLRTYTARDACGNIATATKTVTYTSDLTPPVLTTGGGSLTLGCNPAASDINNSLGTATATDACGVPTVSPSDGAVQSTGCSRSQTRTFTARDFCGNTSTASRTVTWTADVLAPVLTTGGGSLTLGCNPVASDINNSLGTSTATDACGVPTVSQSDGTVQSTGCSRSQTRTFTARDFCGNTSTASRTVTWTADVTPPVFTFCPPPMTVSCEAEIPPCSASDVTATDNCGPVQIICSSVTDIQSGGATCASCEPPSAASACTPPSTFNSDVVVNGTTTWAALLPGISPDNITTAIRITGTGKVTVPSGDVILKSAAAVLVIDGVELVVNSGNLKLDAAGARFIMDNGILRTYGNMEQKPQSSVCITNSTVEIGDEAANGLFNTGGTSTSANFQNDGGYRYLRGVCLNVTHDLQLSSTSGGQDVFINVCAEIGDRGATHASTGTVDGDDSGNLQNNKNMQFYCSEFVVMENIQNQSSSAMFVCNTDFRTLNGSLQNAGTLSGSGLCLAIDDQINNTGTWTVTIDSWFAGGSVTGVSLGTESTLADVLENCFGDCSCTSTCSGTITRTYTAFDGCGNTATCVQVITLSSDPSRNNITLANVFEDNGNKIATTPGRLKVTAYPNPFTDKVNFVIESPVSGQATLEIFNILGQKLETVYHGYLNAELRQVVEYRTNFKTSPTLIYRLKIGSSQVTGKLINIGD